MVADLRVAMLMEGRFRAVPTRARPFARCQDMDVEEAVIWKSHTFQRSSMDRYALGASIDTDIMDKLIS